MTTVRTATAFALAALVLAAAPALAAEEPAAPDTAGLVNLTPEELLVRASSSALQYAALIGPATRLLVSGYERSVPFLITRLDTDDVRERIAVEDILFKIGSNAVEPLIGALPHEAQRTDTTRGARLAAGILGRIGDGRAVDALVAIHEHAEWKVRASVAEALGGIGDARAARALAALLRDENEIVRKSAAVALAKVERKTPGRDLDGDVVRALVSALDDPFYSVRYGAAGALGAIGEPVIPDLATLAEDGGGAARLLAIRALGETGSPGARRELRALLKAADWPARAEAARALGKIGLDGASRRDLERLLRREDHPLVIASAKSALEAGREG